MPCYEPDDKDEEIESLRRRFNERTDMLCRTLKSFENQQRGILNLLLDKDIYDWWIEHKAFDSNR